MSSFIKNTKNPMTGKFEGAFWLDDYFGPHHYGVKFEDGTVYDPDHVSLKTNEKLVTTGAKWPESEEKTMQKPIIYIFMNKGLQMSPGKLAAQAAHAMTLVSPHHTRWLDFPHRWVLIMEARDESHLRNIEQYLQDRHVSCFTLIDEGANETDPHVMTALATNVVDKEDESIQKIFSTFKTYRELIRFSGDIER